MWISLLDETDDKEDSAEDSNSSDDGMKAIREDLERQRKVSSPSSPKENRFLAGFMRSSDKQPLDALAKQALDKDPISLFSPLDQAEDEALSKKRGQRTGDVTGHGGSMSVQHGSSSLDPPDDAHAADLRSAADVIRNGTSLSHSQAPSVERNNFVAPSQVDSFSGTLMTDKPVEEQGSMKRALALSSPAVMSSYLQCCRGIMITRSVWRRKLSLLFSQAAVT